MSIAEQLRHLASPEIGTVSDNHAPMLNEAADMLEFFLGQMQSHSISMDGNHSYRFMRGWPMQYCRGPNAEDAVRAAIAEMKREKGTE